MKTQSYLPLKLVTQGYCAVQCNWRKGVLAELGVAERWFVPLDCVSFVPCGEL